MDHCSVDSLEGQRSGTDSLIGKESGKRGKHDTMTFWKMIPATTIKGQIRVLGKL